MKFQKKINNNFALACDQDGKDLIVSGKGISFGKKQGDSIQPNEIEISYKSEEEATDLFDKSFSEISTDVFELTETIVSLAQSTLSVSKISMGGFISLADHLDYALKRSSEATYDYPDNLKWEVKRLYPKEYDLATDVLHLIEKRTDIRLPISEITFLTYHFVNLQYGTDVKKKSYELSELINKIIDIVQYQFQMILDQNSINYIRFVTHIRHFALRQINREAVADNVIDEKLFMVVQDNYQKSYQTAEKIIHFVESKYDFHISTDETFYLTLHIQRVTNKNE